jgi:hypothetical protein
MARRMNSEEANALENAPAQDVFVSPDEMIRLLMEKRDEAMQLTAESQSWFGDEIPSRR